MDTWHLQLSYLTKLFLKYFEFAKRIILDIDAIYIYI